MSTTNYADTLIAVAPDSPATHGAIPKQSANPSVAPRAFRMIHDHPYRYTSDDVLFEVFADRHEVPSEERPQARRDFFSEPQACLRASDLGKRYGWGVHSDTAGRVALYGVESAEYAALASGQGPCGGGAPVTVTYAMRSRR